ncbi:MAG: hypothetical protein WCJ42_07645 [Actinomycetes bacterium]
MATGEDDADPWNFLAGPKKAAPSEVAPAAAADDPWDFLATRKAKVAAARDSESNVVGATTTATGDEVPAPKRARGELRADMGGLSLRRRAWPLALALAAVAFAGFLTEIVASSQLIALAGPSSLIVVYPLGGLGLLIVAAFQFKFVDQTARLPLLRAVTFGYAVAFTVGLALIAGSILPIVATALIWLLGDQLNFLLPLLIWTLIGDEFNVAEGRKIFGWIVACTYVGQVLGLGVSAVSPVLFSGLHLPLPALLVVDPVICVLVGICLPRVLKGTAASTGLVRAESLKESLAGAKEFINGVPVWRSFLACSALSFTAGMTAYISYLGGLGRVMSNDAAGLQTVLGSVAFVTFLVCMAIQMFAAERIQNRIGIPGALLILPIATLLAGALLALGTAMGSIAVMVAGITFWNIPRWSVDENARRAALALVPDERRARISFIVDLGPVALGLIVSGPLALLGLWFGWYALIPAIAALIAAAAIPHGLAVRRGWEESLLNWRLRRRKQNRTLDFGEDV